ncbi:hypothetical protein D6779_08590 [Candidatus Parcubacteria bacterium]|nr:MAG: hypothetical protein D6779_08590 [Candidatus Parcubacteria bacterium]
MNSFILAKQNLSLRDFSRIILIVIIAIIPHLYKFTFSSEELFSGFIPDDAGYYFKTAINIYNGLGSTFDGINITNGYHPLWMLFCTGAAFFSSKPATHLYWVLFINLIIVVLLNIQLIRMYIETLGLYFIALLLWLINWSYYGSITVLSGLETGIYLLSLLFTIDWMIKLDIENKFQLFLMGILLALTFLARTEAVLFLPIFGGYFWARISCGDTFLQRIKTTIPALTIVGIPFIALTIPYLLWNYQLMGHFQQISGLTKDLWAEKQSIWGITAVLYYLKMFISPIAFQPIFALAGSYTSYGLINSLPVLLFLFGGYLFLRQKGQLYRVKSLLILLLYALTIAVYYFLSYGRLTRYWHLSVIFISIQIMFVFGLQAIFQKLSFKYKPSFILLLVIIGGIYFFQIPYFRYKFAHDYNYHFIAPVYYQKEITEWINTNLPPDAVVGVWNAGYVGYFAERRIVNLDGLINGRELFEYVRDGRGIEQYILDNRIEYISDYFFGVPYPLQWPVLGPRLELLYSVGPRKITRNGQQTYVDWLIWKINYEGIDTINQ